MGVVITGLGVLSPLGPDRETGWQALLSGKPPEFAPSSWATSNLTDFPGFSLADTWLEQNPGWTRLEQLAVPLARAALQDAGWNPDDLPHPERWGCVVGTSKGPLQAYDDLRSPVEATESAIERPAFPQLWPSGGQRCARSPLVQPVWKRCSGASGSSNRGIAILCWPGVSMRR